MAKHDNNPLPYTPRVRDTKSVAQRLNLGYLNRPERFQDLRRKLTWLAPAAAAMLSLPFISGLGNSERVFSNGPVADQHAMFQDRCEACHRNAFSSVSKQACVACHDGPPHPAKSFDRAKIHSEPACTQCHVEHRGGRLAAVADGNCTGCHGDLAGSATGVRLTSGPITSFRAGKHPDFPDRERTDTRPLKLNHAAHLPVQAKTMRGIKLPMQCADCHATSRTSARGDLEPVNFDRHCLSCHQRELEFLLPGLAVEGPPAPHSRDIAAIRQFIAATYRKLVAENPSLATNSIERDGSAEPSAEAWINKAARRSEQYLFERKCTYCHEVSAGGGPDPIIHKVHAVRGRYAEAKPEGEPWLPRGEFSHRAHRAVECESCHTSARGSTKTADILIPHLKDCAACHGPGGKAVGRCYECHLYHNKELEKDRERRPAGQLLGSARREAEHAY